MNRTFTLVLALFAAALLPACDKETESNLKNLASEANKSVGELAESASNVSAEAFENLKSQFSEQADMVATQIDTLKKSGANYKDQQLDGLLKQADAKVVQIKSKIAEVTSAQNMETVTNQVSTWMGEAGELVQKATERLQELAKAAAGGG